MLSEKQKRERFVALRERNYRASLQLEGFDVEPAKVNAESDSTPESVKIAKLKEHYAR
ncbi:YhfG family protein [Photobacterium atrarenae]|uniref:YhfG family protein n=1 Tax=Photobacterium atrarenae TaxID=865757 RepID=A0ABY5GNZ7_9GAMM|nr:YhfG family protein [Photobacterium atrarenae]UTV30028.1 YhfG family protein [Photobacterium atrarenae]